MSIYGPAVTRKFSPVMKSLLLEQYEPPMKCLHIAWINLAMHATHFVFSSISLNGTIKVTDHMKYTIYTTFLTHVIVQELSF